MTAVLARAPFLILLVVGSTCTQESKGPRDQNGATKEDAPAETVPTEQLPDGDSPAPGEEGPVTIAAGEFSMGAETPDKTHAQKHKVTLDAYELDRYEVTAEEYAACVAKGSCTKARTGGMCTGEDIKK